MMGLALRWVLIRYSIDTVAKERWLVREPFLVIQSRNRTSSRKKGLAGSRCHCQSFEWWSRLMYPVLNNLRITHWPWKHNVRPLSPVQRQVRKAQGYSCSHLCEGERQGHVMIRLEAPGWDKRWWRVGVILLLFCRVETVPQHHIHTVSSMGETLMCYGIGIKNKKTWQNASHSSRFLARLNKAPFPRDSEA